MPYTTRPPATAKTARKAWDYFIAKYPPPYHVPDEMFYTPVYDYEFRGWVMEWQYDESRRNSFGSENESHFVASELLKSR
jgi:hypothetical protein